MALAIAVTVAVGFLVIWGLATLSVIDEQYPALLGLIITLAALAVLAVLAGVSWLLFAVWSAV
jgi:hypothetical protein